MNFLNKKSLMSAIMTALQISLMMFLSIAQADDVEVYMQAPPEPLPPNILFILDESGSMSSASLTAGKNRNKALKDAMHAVLYDAKLENVNAAIMGYTTVSGSSSSLSNLRLRIMSDFKTIVKRDADGNVIEDNRATLDTAVQSLQTHSYTPSSRSLQAGALWFDQGFTDYYGKTGQSPLDEINYCAANSIVFLTDGLPNANSMTKYDGPGNPAVTSCASNSYSYGGGGRCSQDIADWTENADMKPTWTGKQNIKTYSVSMISNNDAQNYLRSIARTGHGYTWDCAGLSAEDTALCLDDDEAGFYLAGGEDALVDALKSIVEETMSSVNYSFNAPAIPVNPGDTARIGDHIYVPMLVPTEKGSWKGNLKRYNLKIEPDGRLLIKNAEGGGDAVDNNPASVTYNQFYDTAKSAWDVDGEKDGNDPLLGGLVEQFWEFKQINVLKNQNGGTVDYDKWFEEGKIRRIISWLGDSKDLMDKTNRIIPSKARNVRCSENTFLVPELLNVATTKACNPILKWVVTGNKYKGVDEEGNPIIEYKFGAPIHTKPIAVAYGSTEIVYIPSSDGMLHAIDGETGVEQWAFIPKELLFDVKNHKTPSVRKPIYGLDGNITKVEKNGKILLVFGQRRGGKNYWAIDVTNKMEPKLAYHISPSTPGFTQLGQTWSQPVWATLDDTDVLVFGGGYDADQDAITKGSGRATDDEGTKVYIIDAFSGSKKHVINAASNSIPAKITTADLNSDGNIDRLYIADIGGRIIRADYVAGSWVSGEIADVGATELIKFFNKPVVGYESGANPFLSILIGSGNRAEPLEASNDTFFMIKDRAIWEKPDVYKSVDLSKLIDITDTDSNEYTDELKNAEGWFFSLPTGTKVFSQAALLDYIVVFSTYSETQSGTDVCKAASSNGEARLYALNMLTGIGAFTKNDSTEPDAERETYRRVTVPGIPPEPVIVTDAGDEATGTAAKKRIMEGLQTVFEVPFKFYQLNWEEVLNENPYPY